MGFRAQAHTHTHTRPSSSFKAFQMSRGCITLPATELLILVQRDNDSSLNEKVENITTPFCYQTISEKQIYKTVEFSVPFLGTSHDTL